MEETKLSFPRLRNGALLQEVRWIVRWWWLQRPGQLDEKIPARYPDGSFNAWECGSMLF